MKKIIFSHNLLNKYLANECTAEEKSIVEDWYNKQLEQNDFSLNVSDFDKTEENIWQSINTHQQTAKIVPIRRIKTWQVISVAAACILAVLFINMLENKRSLQAPVASSRFASVPAKENYLIQLPDGSIVLLDKNSKLDYPKSFKGKRLREVYLNGKAFFDIRHNQSQPFIVHAGKVKTTVLGTAFDIIANPESDVIVVRVIRGKVNVATKSGSIGDLLPNKKVTYYIKTDRSQFSTVDAQKEMQWTSQNMVLNDITFEGICSQLEKRYSVKIVIENTSLKDKKFTISLGSDENLDNFLKTICDFNDAQYHYDKTTNQYTITANPN